MLNRKPVAPNNRINRMSEFRASLVSQAFSVNPTVSNSSPSIKSWARTGRPIDGSVGGSYRIKK